LQSSVNAYRDGNCPLEVDYIGPSASGRLKMSSQWRVQPRDELIGQLREQFGKNNVTLHYD
jgi:DNA polymerase-3 subunit alpha